MRPESRTVSRLLAVLLVAASTMMLTSCVEDLDDPALAMAGGAQTNDMQPVSVTIRGIAPDENLEMYSVAGTDYTIELTSVWLVAGNMTVLAKGDPVPGYAPESPFAPLSTGVHSVESYTAVDLLSSAQLGPVDVPVGWAGPVYLSLTTADGQVIPENLDDAAVVDDHMIVIEAILRMDPDVERNLEVRITGEELKVLGAPAFQLDASTEIEVAVDIRGWFSDMDPSSLVQTTNPIVLSAEENIDAWMSVRDAALLAVEDASVSIP